MTETNSDHTLVRVYGCRHTSRAVGSSSFIVNHHTVFLNEPDVHQSIERLAAADKLTIILEGPVNPPERTLSLNTRLVWIDDDGALFDWV